jgi:hypothetical protein
VQRQPAGVDVRAVTGRGGRDHVLRAVDADDPGAALEQRAERQTAAEAEVEHARARVDLEALDGALVEGAVAAVHGRGHDAPGQPGGA